jgi:hypothetical protein
MNLTTRFARVFSKLRQRFLSHGESNRSARSHRTDRLQLWAAEVLEDRTLLAIFTFTVSSTLDDGAGWA